MNNKLLRHSVMFVALAALSTPALAEVTINGFLTTSVVMMDTDEATYLNGAITDEARFDNLDSRLGLQFSAPITNRISATAQLLTQGSGDTNTIATDWAFVSVAANNETEVRTGKLKLSTFLLSDYIEVGYAYPWIRPPQEVYKLNPINTLVGMDALYTPTIGNARLMIQPFVGSNRSTTTILPVAADSGAPVAKGTVLDFSVDNLFGLNIVSNFDAFSLRLGALQSTVSQDTFGIDSKKAVFMSAGFTMDWRNIVIYSEYGQRDEEKEMENAFPDQKAYYFMAGYRFGRFLPHLTYASLEEGNDAHPFASEQESITAGLRYEFMDGAALKFEAQKVDPTGNWYGLFDNGIDNAMIYGVALDVIF